MSRGMHTIFLGRERYHRRAQRGSRLASTMCGTGGAPRTKGWDDMAARRDRRLAHGVACTLVGAIAWGVSGTCIQALFSSTAIDPLLLTTIRLLGAGTLFLAVMLARRRAELRTMLGDRATLVRLAVFGVFGLLLNSVLYSTTVSYTNAGTATVLQSLNIVIVLAVSCLGERRAPRVLEAAALACALAATLLIATHGDLGSIKLPVLGLASGLATAVAATFYTMYPRRLFREWGSLAVTGLGMLAGGACGLALCVIDGTVPGNLPVLAPSDVAVLTVAVLVGTFGAYGLYLHGISIVGPLLGNMLGAAEPVSATVLAALWLATAFSWADWAGLALMVATIVLVAMQGRVGLRD